MTTQEVNDQLVLIAGFPAMGKSASLRKMRNQPKGMYLGTEAGKRLPFKNTFNSFRIDDPYQVIEAFDFGINNPDKVDYLMLDSITFLMDMYETQYVLTAPNTMKAWGDYNQFFKIIMQQKVVQFAKPVIITAHLRDDLDEKAMEMKTAVPIKGALKNNGVESYFSTVVAAKTMRLKDLEPFKSDLLTITDEEKDIGYKHVFQTRLTKETIGERIRSPMGMFDKNQTFIDNDAQVLLDHLHRFYGS